MSSYSTILNIKHVERGISNYGHHKLGKNKSFMLLAGTICKYRKFKNEKIF